MAIIDEIFKSMREGAVYSPAMLSEMTGEDRYQVSKILDTMSQTGGVVECVESHRYKVRRKYQTKQKNLFN